ncbi:MAG: dihydrodipicolinate reductase [Saprospiraceae bacterium]|nr:dihydrodipicolinate reductase [Saprospiraceae bacterium]
MQVIKIVQIGMGPLGVKIAKMIAERKGIQTVAAVDINPALQGQDLGELCDENANQVLIESDLTAAVQRTKPDIAVLTTVSDVQRISNQVKSIVELGLPLVSTCEELSHPWEEAPTLARQMDDLAKAHGVAILGTGVNPGFLMDALPTFLTAVNQEVTQVTVKRYQDAQFRRIPFQQKIGAGLSLEAFEGKKAAGTLRHVGLTESMQMIAKRMGWDLEKTEDVISPVVAKAEIRTAAMNIPAGHAAGVRQVGRGFVGGEVKIELQFQAAVGEPESYDEIIISGQPNIQSRIVGGVNGDIATGAITINAIPRVLEASPGLKTMMEISPVSFFS